MGRMPLAVCLVVFFLAGCFAPREQVAARNWRPMGASGLPLGQLVARTPGLKSVTWESFVDGRGRTVARLAAEYAPAGAYSGCPAPEPGLALAARSFLLLDLAVSPEGAVEFQAATAQAYDAAGYYEEYTLDAGVVAALVAGVCPVPCADLRLPAYLEKGPGSSS